MRTRLVTTVALAALALSACGGGDDGGDGSPQDEVADMMIETLRDADDVEGLDVEIDEDCVRDATSGLGDDDARAIVEAGPEGEADVGEDARAVGMALFECVRLGDVDFGDLGGLDTGDLDTNDVGLGG